MLRLYVFDEELKHYGVKGMKWGVRKDRQTSDRRRRPALKPGDMVIKRGTKFQRITGTSNMGYTQGVFLSYAAKDKELYRGVLGRARVSQMIQNEPGEVKLKQLTMTANRDIRIPPKEKRIKELEKLMRTDKEAVIDLINAGEASASRSRGYDASKTNAVDNTMYERFNHALGLGVEKHPVIAKYYQSLKKQGYDAIPDENDIRLSTFKARAPVIFFDTMDSIGSTRAKDLTSGEVFEAYNRSVGKMYVRRLLMPSGIGFERLSTDSKTVTDKANRRQLQDKDSLNKNYTMTNLAQNWGVDRLSSRQIRSVSKKMDEGKTHAEATAEVVNIGNKAVDKILSRYKL